MPTHRLPATSLLPEYRPAWEIQPAWEVRLADDAPHNPGAWSRVAQIFTWTSTDPDKEDRYEFRLADGSEFTVPGSDLLMSRAELPEGAPILEVTADDARR